MLALASACAATDQAAPQLATAPLAEPAAPATGVASGKIVRVADALLMAARAEQAKDGAALAQATLRLEQLGANPQTDVDASAMQRWRASLPGDVPPMRGRALGPAYRSGALAPGAVTELNQTFLGGRSAQIVVRVSKGPAPQLVVRDQSDRRVCLAGDDPVECRWTPIYTQRHRIEIVNTGSEKSEFYIVFD
jgi:hypothetical protein